MIGIINYGVGNLLSIKNMFKKIGVDSIIANSPLDIKNCDKLILPGVGAFDTAMENYKNSGFEDIVNEKVLISKTPILGICLGMQMMCNSSEEGLMQGLSWIDARVLKFKFDKQQYKIPHMGWNVVTPVHKNSLFKNIMMDEIKYYHVHSYFVKLNDDRNKLATTQYEFDFTSAFEKENIFGVQFHPEKSHKYGYELLKNFSSI